MTNWIPVNTPPPLKCAPKDFVYSVDNDDTCACSEWVLALTKYNEYIIVRLEQWDDDEECPPRWTENSRERLEIPETELLFWTHLPKFKLFP